LAYRGAFYAAAYGRAVRRARYAAVRLLPAGIDPHPENFKLMFYFLELVPDR
jgi:hypothetical protein